MTQKFTHLLGSVLLSLIIGEIFILIIGYRVFRPEPIQISYEPSAAILPDSILGYTSCIGLYKTNKNNQLLSSALHWSDHSRATRQQEYTSSDTVRPRIHLYGCSLAYGQHLEDPMTMAWNLQNLLPQYDVRNYAFIGYGLHQSFLQIQSHFTQQNIPEVLIVNYASFHNERNVLTRNRQKQLVPYVRQKTMLDSLTWPVYTLDETQHLVLGYNKLSYQEWPLMRWSAMMHFVEHSYNQLLRDKEKEELISFLLLKEIQQLANQHKVELLITGIFSDQKTKTMLKRCKKAGMQVLDISVDLENNEFNLMPYDGHPNERAHEIYADKIYRWLVKEAI